MSELLVPFNKPAMVGNEIRYILESLQAGHISGDGGFTKRCHSFLEEEFGVPRALLTTSCTHALEMSSILLNVGPGDEIIVPSFTFVSTVNAFAIHGAKPVFCDIRPDTLNLDESRLEALITARTKAIVVVHYAGVSCEMDSILKIAADHGLAVVEDNAHGLFGRYRGRYLGTLGCLATQSFHETKNITCGEGGALLINAPEFAERAEIIREKGTNRSQYFRGEIAKYSWVDVGSSYLPSDVLAAFLFAQIERWPLIQERRKQIWDQYWRGLEDWAASEGVGLPYVPPYCEQAHHMFYLLMPSLEAREDLRLRMKAAGVYAAFHYIPLHTSEAGRRYHTSPHSCPVTEHVSDRLLRLPFYFDLTGEEQGKVIELVRSWTSTEKKSLLAV